MYKKLGLILLLLISIFASAYSVEYLNSCGKNSGWIQGETYILNFTSIPSTLPSQICFTLNNAGAEDNIIFNGTEQIINDRDSLTLFYFGATAGTWDNYQFNNIDVTSTSTLKPFTFIRTDGSTTSNFNDFQYNNITLDQFRYVFWIDHPNRHYRAKIDNMFVKDSEFWIAFSSGGSSTARFLAGDITNSYINTNRFIDAMLLSGQLTGTNYTNSVILYNTIDPDVGSASLFTNSLTNQYTSLDANDDNQDDTNSDPIYLDSKVRVDLRDFSFIQDAEEGFDLGSFNNVKLIPINNEVIDISNFYNVESQVTLDSTRPLLLLNNFETITLNSLSSIDCTVFNSSKCVIQDNSLFTTVAGLPYRGMIALNGDNLITNLDFTKSRSNNAHIIANDNAVTITDININNNEFNKADDNFRNSDNHAIKLLGNNINFNFNDIFLSSTVDGTYEIFDVSSTLPDSNVFTRNQIFNLVSSPTNDSEIFTENCDVDFYNNNIGTKLVVSESCTDVDVDVISNYLHTDGKIYQFEIGNFYTDNVGCVDGDSNGICDSSYMSGAVNETKPLSSYPFDFVSHLFTADNVIDSSTYNINLIDIVNNQNITIADGSTPLIFTFQHDSGFTDLNCDFILDGVSVETINNPINNTDINSSSLIGWTEKSYTHRVDCSNNIIINNNSVQNVVSSNEITFNINFGTGTGDGGDTNTTSTDATEDVINSVGGFTGLYGDDVTSTGNSVIDIFKLFESPIGYLYLFGFILLFISIIGIIFAFLRIAVIGGK